MENQPAPLWLHAKLIALEIATASLLSIVAERLPGEREKLGQTLEMALNTLAKYPLGNMLTDPQKAELQALAEEQLTRLFKAVANEQTITRHPDR